MEVAIVIVQYFPSPNKGDGKESMKAHDKKDCTKEITLVPYPNE